MTENVKAKWIPENGMEVFDCHMDKKGEIGEYHFGHPVQDLGEPLPELDQPRKIEKLRILQRWMQHIIDSGQLDTDNKVEEDLFKAWDAAKKRGSISSVEWQTYQTYVKYINELFGALEDELVHNWTFWTM